MSKEEEMELAKFKANHVAPPSGIEIDLFMEQSFTGRMCDETYKLLKYQFPNISGLDVSMDEEGIINIIFDETEYTAKEVNDFLQEFRKQKIKKAEKPNP